MLVSTVQSDLIHAQVGVRHVAQAHGSTGSGNLFHGDHVIGITAPGTSVFRRNGYAQETERSQFLPTFLQSMFYHYELGQTLLGVALTMNGAPVGLFGFFFIFFSSLYSVGFTRTVSRNISAGRQTLIEMRFFFF